MAGKVQMIFEGDSAKAVQALDKTQEKLRALEQKFAEFKRTAKDSGDQVGKVGDHADEMGKKGEGALGSMTRGFGGMLASVVSVSGAIGLATKALADMNAEGERAADLARGIAPGLQQLVQISGSKQELGALTSFSRALSQQEGLTPQQAAQAVFTGRSLGFSLEAIADVAPVARAGGDLEEALRGAGKMREAFGMREIGSERGVLSKAGVAAATSDIDFREFLKASIGPAASFARIGASDESLLAAMSVLSGPAGATPDIAATQIRSLATSLAKEGVAGQDFFGKVQAIAGLPEETRQRILGRVEAAGAYTLLTRDEGALLKRGMALQGALVQEGLASAIRIPGTGGGVDWLAEKAALAEGDPVISAVLRERRAKSSEEWSALGLRGPDRLDTETVIKQIQDASVRAGEGGLARWYRTGKMRTAQFLLGDRPGVVEDVGLGGPTSPGGGPAIVGPMLRQIQEEQRGGALDSEAVERLTQALEENTKATIDAGPGGVSDNRVQTFYGAANERAQQRSPAPRRDPSTGR